MMFKSCLVLTSLLTPILSTSSPSWATTYSPTLTYSPSLSYRPTNIYKPVTISKPPPESNAISPRGPASLEPLLAPTNTTGFLCNQDNSCDNHCCTAPRPRAFHVQFDARLAKGDRADVVGGDQKHGYAMRVLGVPGMPEEMWVTLFGTPTRSASFRNQYWVDGLPELLWVSCGNWCGNIYWGVSDEKDDKVQWDGMMVEYKGLRLSVGEDCESVLHEDGGYLRNCYFAV